MKTKNPNPKPREKTKNEEEAARFANRLRAALEENGQSQAELLKLLAQNGYEIPQARLSHYMQGRNYPDPPALRELARAMEVSADYLLGLTERSNSVEALEEMLARAKGESPIDTIMERLPAKAREQVMGFAEYLLARHQETTRRLPANGGATTREQRRAEILATLDSVERQYGMDARLYLEGLARKAVGTVDSPA